LAFHREVEYRALAKLLVARAAQQREAPGEDVLALIDQLQTCCEKAGARFQLIDVLLSKAVALKLDGKPDEALAALESSLELGGPECFIGTYLVQNPPVIAMLAELKSRGHPSPQLTRILTAHEERLPASPSAVSQAALIEPLSDRELDVLRYLNSSLTSSEIADELYVAVSTVRSHIKSIYQKLGVHRRIEAVERARELGLL
jgi:LuxR family maltose regulon positive regulatory protein